MCGVVFLFGRFCLKYLQDAVCLYKRRQVEACLARGVKGGQVYGGPYFLWEFVPQRGNSFHSMGPDLEESPVSCRGALSLCLEVPLCLSSGFVNHSPHPGSVGGLNYFHIQKTLNYFYM